MSNESERWLKTIIVVLAILIMVGLIMAQEAKITRTNEIINAYERALEEKELTETDNDDLLFVDPYIPPTAIMFGDFVGKLTWEDGKMKFEGDAYESAKIFFDYFLVMYIDDYIEARMAEKEAIRNQVFTVRLEEGLWVVVEEKEPEMILFEFTSSGEFAKEFRPQLFLKITNTDLSRCFIDGRLRLDLNGEIYWIRLEK